MEASCRALFGREPGRKPGRKPDSAASGGMAVGYEPTACCLRNIGALFHFVPLRSVDPNLSRLLRFQGLRPSRSIPLRSSRLLAVLLADLPEPTSLPLSHLMSAITGLEVW